jgi:hypothetical protein
VTRFEPVDPRRRRDAQPEVDTKSAAVVAAKVPHQRQAADFPRKGKQRQVISKWSIRISFQVRYSETCSNLLSTTIT